MDGRRFRIAARYPTTIYHEPLPEGRRLEVVITWKPGLVRGMVAMVPHLISAAIQTQHPATRQWVRDEALPVSRIDIQ